MPPADKLDISAALQGPLGVTAEAVGDLCLGRLARRGTLFTPARFQAPHVRLVNTIVRWLSGDPDEGARLYVY